MHDHRHLVRAYLVLATVITVVAGTLSTLVVSNSVASAQTTPQASAQTVTAGSGAPITLQFGGAPPPNVATWDAVLPALKADLAAGDSASEALAAVGMPPISATAVNVASGNAASPNGFTCRDWTCGYEFDSLSTFEIEWLVWAGVLSSPALVCALLGPETAATACLVAGILWGILSAYVWSPPSYPSKCIYIGVGIGEKAEFVQC